MKFVPNKSNWALVISKVLAPASLAPSRLITREFVVACSVSAPTPPIAALQAILLPVKVRLPILLRAPVIEIEPVPALRVSALLAPDTNPFSALLIVILPLLAVLLSDTSAAMSKVTPLPPRVIEPAPAVANVVVKVPAKVTDVGPPSVGVNTLNALPPIVKVLLALLPKVRLPVVLNGVVVEKSAILLVEPTNAKL